MVRVTISPQAHWPPLIPHTVLGSGVDGADSALLMLVSMAFGICLYLEPPCIASSRSSQYPLLQAPLPHLTLMASLMGESKSARYLLYRRSAAGRL